MPRQPKGRTYKELTFQQLRSFGETARLGSLAAAAKSLGLTHPTVREQVLALEREFQVKLVESHGRGSRLTADGRLLAEMVAPIVTSAAALRRRFETARKNAEVRLVVAGTPRFFQEDLPEAIAAWLERHPQARIVFLELRDDQVVSAVASGTADFGLTSDRIPDPLPPGIRVEPGYEMETLLVTARTHPLARKARVRPADLRKYPVLTSRYTLSDEPDLAALLERRGVFEGPPPRVEPFLAATVRRYVELDLGIALVYGPLRRTADSPLHERSMSGYFGRGLVRFVYRSGAAAEDHARTLGAAIQEFVGRSERRRRRTS
jgi:DNA-binding transcriptional LysR family regulator